MTERDIFLAVLDLPDPAARIAYLDSACGGDSARRARVEALLQAHENAGSFLAEPAAAVAAADRSATEAFPATPDAEGTQTAGGASGSDDESLTFLSPPLRPDSLGRIGHYEVLEVLGRGGFGIVFRAFDEVLQRVVAVKVLAPTMAATSPARKRFLREARSSAQVRHENVVQVYAVEEQPLPYLVMEFIPGETLQQRLDRTGPLDVPEVLRIGRQIAEGLAAAHAQGLIHRDVKPANVLIEGGPAHRAKLTDFGLARAADDASISQSGVVAGTPMYMAPEQAKGESLDHRADLFSFGSVLYVMCSGRPPFRASGTLAVLKRVCEEDPRPIREVIPEVPEWLCRIIEKLHAKDPVERFQSAREVADVLTDCETQWKAHGMVKDNARIPEWKPESPQGFGFGRVAITAVFGIAAGVSASLLVHLHKIHAPWLALGLVYSALFLFIGLSVVSATRKARGRKFGHVAFGALLLALTFWAGPAVVRYLRNQGEVGFEPQPGLNDIIVLQNDVIVHDWMDMRRPQLLTLPAGQYQLNMGLVPGYDYWTSGWEVEKHWLLGGVTMHMSGPSLQLTVDRGERVTVRALPHAAPAEAATTVQPAVGIAGTWESVGGPVTLEHGPIEGRSAVTLSGSYLLNDGKNKGVITRGTYYPFKRTAQFEFAEPWWGGTGSVELTLSADGNELGGTWRNSKGEGGVWPTMRRLQPLAAESGWVQIFNGKDLTGWKTHPDQPGDWRVDDGILIGSRGPSYLFSDRGDYENVHIRVEAKINKGGNSGVLFHSKFGFDFELPVEPVGTRVPLGYEVEFASNSNVSAQRTGSVFRCAPPLGMTKSDVESIADDTWTVLDIIVRGNHIVTRINGQPATDFVDTAAPIPRGHIALQVHGPETVVRFRKIEIQELAPADRTAAPTAFANGQEIAGWGTVVDPVRDCGFAADPAGLTITVPGGHHNLNPTSEYQNVNAPRVLQKAGGDFSIDVRVAAFPMPDPNTASAGPHSYFGAGLVLWEDGKNFVRFMRAAHGESKRTWASIEYFADGSNVVFSNYDIAVGATWLRIVRSADDFRFWFSEDGNDWTELSPQPAVRLGKKLDVGVAAVNSTVKPFTPRFDQFKFKDGGSASPAIAPFDAAKAAELQNTWAKHLGVPVEMTNSVGMKLRLIPPGEFTMGSSPAEIDWLLKNTEYRSAPPWVQDNVRSEGPDRRVTVPGPFYLGTYEVTVGQFREFTRATGYKTEAETNGGGSVWNAKAANNWDRKPAYVWTNPEFSPSESHPVVFITPRDARAFCKWLSEKDGRRYEIPSEEQWEWACRAGTTTRWFFGDNPTRMKEFGWTSPESAGINHPVGRLAPNPFGLYDMYGNAAELAITPQGQPKDRGGDAGVSAGRARSATRNDINHPDTTNFRRGFRVAIVGTPKDSQPPRAIAPFDAAKAKEYQEAWAKHLGVPVGLTNSIGMKFRLIPPGEFTMGSDQEQIAKLKKDAREAKEGSDWDTVLDGEGPVHRVRLTRPYYLGECEVTVAQFRQFVQATGYKTECERNGKGGMVPTGTGDEKADPKASWRNPLNSPAKDDQPVLQMSWNDAQEFCRWLGQKEGRSYRLPTEAEWEFACRAGSAGRFSFGDDAFAQAQHAVFDQDGPAAAGSKKPNQFGLFDMEGNAWEWCADWYAGYSGTAVTDPQGPATGTDRVLRGGDFLHDWWVARPAVRIVLPPSESHFANGFRVVIVGDMKPKAPAGKPSTAVLQGLRELVAAKERALKTTQARVDAGQAPAVEQTLAQIELIEAQIRLAEVERDHAAVLSLLKDLEARRKDERRNVETLIEAGRATPGELDQVDARLAEAKTRLAQAQPVAPGSAAPTAKPPNDATKGP